MAEKVASLYAEIGADTKGLERGLASTKAGLKDTAKQMGGFGATTKDTLKQLAGFAATGLIATKAADAIAGFFKSSVNDTMNYAKAVRDVARFTGASYEESSKLIQIADDLEVSQEALKMGFKNAVRQGILPNIEGLKGLQKEYQSLGSPLEKSQFALEKFGRSGMEMQKFLEATPEQLDEMAKSAERLGLVLDSKAIQSTEDYRGAVDDLSDSWAGLKTIVGSAVIPVLADVAEATTDYIGRTMDLKKAQDLGLVTAEEVYLAKRGAIDIEKILAERTADTADAIMDERKESILAMRAIQDSSGAAEDAIPAFNDFASAVEGVASAFDPIGATVKTMMEGIDKFAGSLAEKQAIFLNFQKSMGLITQEQYDQGLAAIFNLTKLEELNKGIEDGSVTQEEYLSIIKDGKVTTDELNLALFGTVEAMGGIKAETPQAQRAIADFNDTAVGDILEIAGVTDDIVVGIGGIKSATPAAQRAFTDLKNSAVPNLAEVTGGLGGVAGAAVTAAGQVNSITGAINGIPKVTNIRIVITEEYRRTYAGGYKYGPGVKPGGQHGLDMIVPQGYPADSYPVFASSGERVTITPQHKIGKEGGDTYNIYNNSRGAAALTMAIIAQNHRARLGRSMGG